MTIAFVWRTNDGHKPLHGFFEFNTVPLITTPDWIQHRNVKVRVTNLTLKFEVFTAVSANIPVFLDLSPCSLVGWVPTWIRVMFQKAAVVKYRVILCSSYAMVSCFFLVSFLVSSFKHKAFALLSLLYNKNALVWLHLHVCESMYLSALETLSFWAC